MSTYKLQIPKSKLPIDWFKDQVQGQRAQLHSDSGSSKVKEHSSILTLDQVTISAGVIQFDHHTAWNARPSCVVIGAHPNSKLNIFSAIRDTFLTTGLRNGVLSPVCNLRKSKRCRVANCYSIFSSSINWSLIHDREKRAPENHTWFAKRKGKHEVNSLLSFWNATNMKCSATSNLTLWLTRSSYARIKLKKLLFFKLKNCCSSS